MGKHPRAKRSCRIAVLACLVSSVLVGSAQADGSRGRTLLLAASHAAGMSETRSAANTLLDGLPRRVMDPKLARERFEQRGSTPPMLASHSDLDSLAQDTQMALYHVASGLPGQARRDVERALARADKVLESLNRESLAAQHLLDACLYLVRAHLQSRQRVRAREQALECKRLVPDIEPDGTMHPPDVIGMLAEAEAFLKQREPGSLRVESEPERCAVYVNGRRLGTTPLELPQLSPGEYRLQAECVEGELGRVHRVQIQSDRVQTRIDTRFDTVVQTQIDLSLRYPVWQALGEGALQDAVEVGRVVGVEDVYVVAPAEATPGQGVFQVHRLRVRDGKLLGAVRFRIGADGEVAGVGMAQVAADLAAGRFTDRTPKNAPAVTAAVPATAPLLAPAPPAREAPARPLPVPRELASRELPAASEASQEAGAGASLAGDHGDSGGYRAPWPGLALGITGGAALLASAGLYAHLLSLESEYHALSAGGGDASAALSAVQSFELVPLAVALSGAALAGASLPWLLPSAPRPPVWAIVVGAVGGGVMAVGTGLLIAGATCDEFDQNRRCLQTSATSRLGGMLLAWGAPLAGVPLVYILRGPSGQRDTGTLSLGLSPGGLGLSVRGKL